MRNQIRRICDADRDFLTKNIVINPERFKRKDNYATDLVTKHKLKRFKYDGFFNIEKITDNVAMLLKNNDLVFIDGNFKKLEINKRYLISDILRDQIEEY